MSMDWFADVMAFHERFGCHVGSTPKRPPMEVVHLRDRLVDEEYTELFDAMFLTYSSPNLPAGADAIVDLIYVLIGTAIAYGIDIRPLWDAVHRANLEKHGGGKRSDQKVLKPPGWTPPDIAGLLAIQKPLTADQEEPS